MQALSPAAAYRADTRGSKSLGSDDDRWLEIASLVALGQLDSAAERARDLLRQDRLEAHARFEWRSQKHRVASLILLAETIQEGDGHALAACLLDDLLRYSPRLPAIWKGRALALRARLDWKRGNLQEAGERYDHIYSMGVSARQPELKARAEIGRAALAQLQGNLPAVEAHCLSALELAEECGAAGVARFARLGLAVVASNRGDHEAALAASWAVVQLSEGYPVREAEALQNTGQILLVAGYADVAASAFAAVLNEERAALDHILLNALGGLALASARLRREPTVEWCVHEVWRASELAVPRYELASALLESASALKLLGRVEEAERYRSRAQTMADAGDFHQLSFDAEQLAREITATTRPSFQHADSEAIAERIHKLGDHLPRRVAFATGSE